MLDTIEKDALTQLRRLAELHQGGKPGRAQRYRELAEELAAGKIDAVITAFRAALPQHEAVLAEPLTEDERRMGSSSRRLEHMDDEQELRVVLQAIAAVEGNWCVWGEIQEGVLFSQTRRIFEYVERLTFDMATTEADTWRGAARAFAKGNVDPLLDLIADYETAGGTVPIEIFHIVKAAVMDDIKHMTE